MAKTFDCSVKKIVVQIPAPTTSAVPNQTADDREARKPPDMAQIHTTCEEGLEVDVDDVETIRLREGNTEATDPLY